MAKGNAIILFGILGFITFYNKPVISDDANLLNPDIICRQPYISFDCETTFEIWSYNALKGTCVKHNSCFTSHDNKFETKHSCENTCSGIFDAPYGDVNHVRSDESDEQIQRQAYERMNTPDEDDMDNI